MQKETIGMIADDVRSLLRRLSPEQLRAVTSDASAIRMSACAGSGKTETLTTRIIYLLSKGIDPANIVAFTFTDRAAKSMKIRLYRRVVEVGWSDSMQTLAQLFLGTIHSFCLRILQDYGGFDNYDVLDEHREMAFAIEHGKELGLHEAAKRILGHITSYSNAVSVFLRSISVVHNELIDRRVISRFSPIFNELLEKYENLMANHLVFNFGQLISLSVKMLEQNEHVQDMLAGKIKHLLIDEYQDLNPAQERLIQLLVSRGGDLFVVGDTNQSIYQWRGSDVGCFKRFEERFPNSIAVFLNQNRRSVPRIIEVANKVGYSINKSAEEQMTSLKENIIDSVWWVEESSAGDEARWVASKIIELNNSGVKYSDIAVLLRSVNTSGEPFIKEFRRCGVPFVVGGRIGLFRREEAQALGRIFAWLADATWIEDPHIGFKTRQTKYLLQTALLDNWQCTDEEYLCRKRQLEEVKVAVSRNQFRNLTELFRTVVNIMGFLKLDPIKSTDISIMAIMGRFNQLLTDYESTIKRCELSDNTQTNINLKELLKGFTWFVNSYASSAYEEESIDDKREMDA